MPCGREEAACATAGAGASTAPRSSAVLSHVKPSLTWAALCLAPPSHMATRTWPQWRPGGRQAGWTCPARRPQHIAGGRRKQVPQVVQVALLPPAVARSPSQHSARKECLLPAAAGGCSPRKEWLPLPPPLPRWRDAGPPSCAGRLCSSPPHPHRLWPHLHVEHLRCEPWPCLLEEKGSLLAEQGYPRSSPPARPGCGVTLCKAVMPPHPRNSRCSLGLSIVATVHAAE